MTSGNPRNHTAARFAAFEGKTMKPRHFSTAMTAILGFSPLPLMLSAAPAWAQSVVLPAQQVVLSIGNGQLVNVPGAMTDVFVANDSVADVQVKSARSFYVFGKGGGTTTVYASNAAGTVIWSGTIRVGSNFDSVDAMLRVAMPEAKIAVSNMGTNTFLLTGMVKAPEDSAEAERLVQAYVGKDANVISRLQVATPMQVNLQVRIAEVSRSLVKSLTSNIATLDGTNGFKGGIGQGSAVGNAFNPGRVLGVGGGATSQSVTNPITGEVTTSAGSDIAATSTGTTLGLATKLFGLNILASLDAGETVGLATTLAQPNLTALSGETANFLAGGEYPIPISQGTGSNATVAIEYKNYGVSLSYTPTVLTNGRISLRVRPEVSELSSDGAVNLNGYTINALKVRRTETTVELGSGQSFMIAGLLSNYSNNTIQKLPGAGDIPILGSLFRSTSYKRGETELVIVVTPYLVNPVDGSQIVLPTDGYRSPNELQRLLANMNSDGVSGLARPEPTLATESAAAAATPTGKTSKADKKAKKEQAEATATAKPGFNLK